MDVQYRRANMSDAPVGPWLRIRSIASHTIQGIAKLVEAAPPLFAPLNVVTVLERALLSITATDGNGTVVGHVAWCVCG